MKPRPANDDRALLRAFCSNRSEKAFRQLVDRYAGLVFGAALRITGSRELAEEVSQTVFTVLARRASTVTGAGGLAGWLHRCAWYEAVKTRRREQRHERKMKKLSDHHVQAARSEGSIDEAGAWIAALPFLDEALERLPERDRRTVMLHYFEGLTFAEIAERVGGSPAAAQKRGARALRKLERKLRPHGCALSVAALGSGLGAHLAQAAPSGVFAANLAARALAAAPSLTAGASLVNMLLTMNTSKLGIAGAVALTALLFTPVVLQRQAIARTQARVTQLERDNAFLQTVINANTTRDFGRAARSGAPSTTAARTIDLAKLLTDIESASRGNMLAQLRAMRTLKPLDGEALSRLVASVAELDLVEEKARLLADFLLEDLVRKSPEQAARTGAALLDQFSGWDPRFHLSQQAGRGLGEWAKSAPGAALAWFRAADLDGRFEDTGLFAGDIRKNFVEGLFTGLFQSDRAAAAAFLESLDPSTAAHSLSRAGFSAKTDEARRALAESALSLDDAQESLFAFNGVIGSLRDEGLETAGKFLKSLPLEPWFEAELLAVAADPVQNRASRSEIEKALDWLEKTAPEGHAGQAQGKLLGLILIHEPDAAVQALDALRERRPGDDGLVIEFLNFARDSELDVDPLVALALQVGDDAAREAALRSIYERRVHGEEAALHAAFRKAGITINATPVPPDQPARNR